MHSRGLVLRIAFPALLAAGISLPQPAKSQEGAPNFEGDKGLRAVLLPYSPSIFDMMLLVARSFAEITYDGRRFDPVTQSFTVQNLRIKRDQFAMTVRSLRVDDSATLFQGLEIPTGNLALPPPLRAGLERLGLQTVQGDVAVDYRTDERRAAYAVAVQMDFPRLGSLEANGVIDGFHALVPLGEAEPGFSDTPDTLPDPLPGEQPKILGTLRASSLTYRDAGLLDAVIDVSAQAQGVTPEEMRAGLGAMVGMSLAPTVNGLPGNDDPALRDKAQQWSRAVEAFLQNKDSIRITLDPASPVPLERFQTGTVDKQTVAALNPQVESPAPPPIKAVALDGSADRLTAARAQLSGQGAVQDEPAGVRALLDLSRQGDLAAVRALAESISDRAVPALEAEERGALLEFLLVGRALGAQVSDAALALLDASLEAEARRAAEQAASDYFREQTPEGKALAPLTPQTVSTFTPSQLRGMAFDAYEGRTAPRDMTEAYAVALLASAAGDSSAARLRDSLMEAVQAGRIALAADEARARATALWDAYTVKSGAPAPQ